MENGSVDSQGQQSSYQFEIELTPIAQGDTQITITPAQYSLRDNTLDTYAGKATLLDIERGLNVAIATGRIARTHPLVSAVQQCLLTAYNNNTSLAQASAQAKVPLSFLQELGALGLQSSKERNSRL